MAHDDSKTMTICKFFPCSIHQTHSVVWLFVWHQPLLLILLPLFLFLLLLPVPITFNFFAFVFFSIPLFLFSHLCHFCSFGLHFMLSYTRTYVIRIYHVLYYISLVYRFLYFSLFFILQYRVHHLLLFLSLMFCIYSVFRSAKFPQNMSCIYVCVCCTLWLFMVKFLLTNFFLLLLLLMLKCSGWKWLLADGMCVRECW